MLLETGVSVGPYTIVAPLGAGGMGEVYRARDAKLNRDVALKILPPDFALDPDRLARFRREAQLLASLNHPNVAAIYGLEEPGGMQALVLELVEGSTLADRISHGALPLDEALPIARQISEALEAAHEQGIIHRDLKPANIKLREDGTVKVLDFGLAKLIDPAGAGLQTSGAGVSNSSTITSPARTQAGVILGTAAYMSPEQAKGRPADKRSDIWAFGCVLYEMLTGNRAFAGEDIADTLAAIVRGEPDWSAVPQRVPPQLVILLRRCLEKDRKVRIADVSTVRFVFDTPGLTSRDLAAPTAWRPVWRRAVAVAVGCAAACAITGAAAWTVARRVSTPPAITRFAIALPDNQAFSNGGMRVVAISPDGSHLAYADRQQIYVRTMSDGTTRPVLGTESRNGVGLPTFSPDGESLAFFAVTDRGRGADFAKGVIKRVRFDGGTPITLCEASFPLGISWADDGIVFGQSSRGILRVPSNGGTPQLLIAVKENEAALDPQVLPGGRAVLFTHAIGFDPDRARALVDQPRPYNEWWTKSTVVAQSLNDGHRTSLVEGATDGRYLSSGHLVYAVQGVLHAVAFNPNRAAVTGDAVPVVEGVGRARYASIDMGSTQLAVSNNGTLVYLAGPASLNSAPPRDLAILGPANDIQPLKLPPMAYEHPRLAPDGKSVAVGTDDGKEANIWVYDLTRPGPPRQLTFQGKNRYPIWSSDGRRITFQSDRTGDLAIFSQAADGSTAAEQLTTPETKAAHVPQAWTPDGSRLLFSAQTSAGFSLWTFSTRDHRTEPFADVRSSTILPAAAVSPDGRWVAYQSGEIPNFQTFVQSFPSTGAFWTLPPFSRHPRWSPDGTRLFVTAGPELLAVDVMRNPGVRFSKPTQLLRAQAGLSFGPMYANFDVTPGGRFLAPIAAEGSTPAGTTSIRQINVVLNWVQELKQRVPTK